MGKECDAKEDKCQEDTADEEVHDDIANQGNIQPDNMKSPTLRLQREATTKNENEKIKIDEKLIETNRKIFQCTTFDEDCDFKTTDKKEFNRHANKVHLGMEVVSTSKDDDIDEMGILPLS